MTVVSEVSWLLHLAPTSGDATLDLLDTSGTLIRSQPQEASPLMAPPRILPDRGKLMQYRTPGPNFKTYDEIAEMYGVTVGAVYQQLRYIPGVVKPRARHHEFIPWTVKTEHMHAYPVTMLRLLARVESGQTIPDNKRRRLDRWVEEMREKNLVVDYDPQIPPNPASPVYGGFCYRNRRPGDSEWPPIRRPFEAHSDSGSVRGGRTHCDA